MANLKQSKKRIRQDIKRKVINKRNLSIVKTYIKTFLKSLELSDLIVMQKKYCSMVSKIDKSVNNGVFHKNKASRLKCRLNAKLVLKLK